jgi:hypothetical protein
MPPTVLGHALETGRREGSYVHYHDGSYYLFWNEGSCCDGTARTYTIWVARSQGSITGPYSGNRVFYASNGNINGPGHMGVYSACGVERFTYHYYPTATSVLGENELAWSSDDWPVAGAVSTTPLTPCGNPGSGGPGDGGVAGAGGTGGAGGAGRGGSVGTGGTAGSPGGHGGGAAGGSGGSPTGGASGGGGGPSSTGSGGVPTGGVGGATATGGAGIRGGGCRPARVERNRGRAGELGRQLGMCVRRRRSARRRRSDRGRDALAAGRSGLAAAPQAQGRSRRTSRCNRSPVSIGRAPPTGPPGPAGLEGNPLSPS